MAIPSGLNLTNVEAAKAYGRDILKIADDINTEIFAKMDQNQEVLFQAWQSENAKNVAEIYDEMRKSFEKYYNYLKESFDWINTATDKVQVADTEIGKTYTDIN